MKTIEWIAIYAAVVSTIALSWNIINDLNAQADIRLNAEVIQILDLNHSDDSFIDKIFPLDPYKHYCQLRITNVGDRSVVIDEIGIEESDGEKSRLPFSRPPTFPISLKPSEFEICYCNKELILAIDKKIFIKSTKGEKWIFKISELAKNL
jgi:hypothetical protein